MPETLAEPALALDVTPLLGTWRNTNGQSRGIEVIEIARPSPGLRPPSPAHASEGLPDIPPLPVTGEGPRSGGGGSLLVRALGKSAEAQPFALTTDDPSAQAFSAVLDLGYCDVHLQVNIKGGVLVVASFNQFKDGGARSNYFFREFYYRDDES
jgi:hypothetical protein